MQKIVPFLWFDKNAEEAMQFYTSLFPNSKIVGIKRYEADVPQSGVTGMVGKVLTGVFELNGQRFMCLDGGPYFKFNPTVSFTVNCSTAAEVKALFEKLSAGGSVLMPLQKYPFSEMYGWCQDKFGVSWQIGISQNEKVITPSLMFVGDKFGKAEEAIKFYTSTLKNSSIETIARYEKGEHDVEGKVKYAAFVLEGQRFIAMESSLGHQFKIGGAISFYIECKDQEEIDYYWNKLSAVKEAEQCGWLTDQYGFAWQIVPKVLGEMLEDKDKAKADRAMQAMLGMKKLDIAGLEKAYNGK